MSANAWARWVKVAGLVVVVVVFWLMSPRSHRDRRHLLE
jgi:cell division septal protein FtsQ